MSATISDGQLYAFVNWDTKTLIDLKGGSPTNGTPLIGYPGHLQTPGNQAWLAKSTDGQYFTLTNGLTGTLMDLSEASSKNGTPIVGFFSAGGDNQKWKFTQVSKAGETPSFSITSKATGTAVELYMGNPAPETPIQGWETVPGGQNPRQRWIAYPLPK